MPGHFQDWKLLYAEPDGDAYSEEEARRRFLSGETMTLLTGDPSEPEAVLVVDLSGRIVEVTWLDHLLRPVEQHLWATPTQTPDWPEDQLILETATRREYDHDQPPPDSPYTRLESYTFAADGSYVGDRVDRTTGEHLKTQGEDPELLRVKRVPAFGEWDRFLKWNQQ